MHGRCSDPRRPPGAAASGRTSARNWRGRGSGRPGPGGSDSGRAEAPPGGRKRRRERRCGAGEWRPSCGGSGASPARATPGAAAGQTRPGLARCSRQRPSTSPLPWCKENSATGAARPPVQRPCPSCREMLRDLCRSVPPSLPTSERPCQAESPSPVKDLIQSSL